MPRSTRPRPVRTRTRIAAGAVSVVAAIGTLSGCSVFDTLTSSDDPTPTQSATPTATETPIDSQFTDDGTFQSHINRNNLDFVYTLYPTKSTPRTNEWYPKGKKYFSFTFQAYDLNRDLRDPFATKRKVYLDHIKVTSTVLTYDGSTVSRQPYRLDAVAKNVTFDPQPQSTKYGMLITSPKGAFELRNQAIKATPMETKGITLTFVATVWAQTKPGSDTYKKQQVKQKVPIAIFNSDKPTQAQSIPVDAN
jgi:hypothetical protein